MNLKVSVLSDTAIEVFPTDAFVDIDVKLLMEYSLIMISLVDSNH